MADARGRQGLGSGRLHSDPATAQRRPDAAWAVPAGRREASKQDPTSGMPSMQSLALAIRAPCEVDTNLRRETPFLCNITYKNDLPEVPSDPKMLVPDLDPERLSRFFITTLEKQPLRELVMPLDLGIPLSLLESERYSVPDVLPPLHPDDLALLGAEDKPGSRMPAGLQGAAPHSKSRGLDADARNPKLSWLMRTTYISNEAAQHRKPAQARPAPAAAAATKEAEEADAREAQIQAIEEMFEAAQKPPVHSRDPSLVPLEVLPVFPDFAHWGVRHMAVVYDADPMEDTGKGLAQLTPEERKRMAEHSMLKSFLPSSDPPTAAAGSAPEDDEARRFMALLVPTSLPAPPPEGVPDAEVDASELEGEYRWSREYSHHVKKTATADDASGYVLRMYPGSHAAYVALEARLGLKKRKRDATFVKTLNTMHLTRRELNEDELQEKQDKLLRLYDVDELPADYEEM